MMWDEQYMYIFLWIFKFAKLQTLDKQFGHLTWHLDAMSGGANKPTNLGGDNLGWNVRRSKRSDQKYPGQTVGGQNNQAPIKNILEWESRALGHSINEKPEFENLMVQSL